LSSALPREPSMKPMFGESSTTDLGPRTTLDRRADRLPDACNALARGKQLAMPVTGRDVAATSRDAPPAMSPAVGVSSGRAAGLQRRDLRNGHDRSCGTEHHAVTS
jgi:hypothetical protein